MRVVMIDVSCVKKLVEGSWFPSIARGERSVPEIDVTKSARFDELKNICFVGYIALRIGLHSHVTE